MIANCFHHSDNDDQIVNLNLYSFLLLINLTPLWNFFVEIHQSNLRIKGHRGVIGTQLNICDRGFCENCF